MTEDQWEQFDILGEYLYSKKSYITYNWSGTNHCGPLV